MKTNKYELKAFCRYWRNQPSPIARRLWIDSLSTISNPKTRKRAIEDCLYAWFEYYSGRNLSSKIDRNYHALLDKMTDNLIASLKSK